MEYRIFNIKNELLIKIPKILSNKSFSVNILLLRFVIYYSECVIEFLTVCTFIDSKFYKAILLDQ